MQIKSVTGRVQGMEIHGTRQTASKSAKRADWCGSKTALYTFERSWRLKEVPRYWRKANVAPVFRKGQKQTPWNYSLVGLTPIPGKFIKRVFLEQISGHIKKVIRNSQHEFTEGWSTWQPSMINWQDLWTRGEQWMSFTLTLTSLLTPSCTTRWIKSQLSGQAQWVMVNGLYSILRSSRVCRDLYCDQSCSTTLSVTWRR